MRKLEEMSSVEIVKKAKNLKEGKGAKQNRGEIDRNIKKYKMR